LEKARIILSHVASIALETDVDEVVIPKSPTTITVAADGQAKC